MSPPQRTMDVSGAKLPCSILRFFGVQIMNAAALQACGPSSDVRSGSPVVVSMSVAPFGQKWLQLGNDGGYLRWNPAGLSTIRCEAAATACNDATVRRSGFTS